MVHSVSIFHMRQNMNIINSLPTLNPHFSLDATLTLMAHSLINSIQLLTSWGQIWHVMESKGDETTKNSTEKRFSCGECGLAFPYRSRLKKHQEIHLQIKTHRCKFCQVAFQQKSNLKAHELTHISEQTHKCLQCNKKFKTKPNLVRHLVTHSEERPFQCRFCDVKSK